VAVDLTITQGELGRTLDVQLQDPDGTFPDLTGLTVTCRVQPAVQPRRASSTAATLLDARAGFVRHTFVAAEVRDPLLLLAQFVVAETGRQYPPGSYYRVEVVPALVP
jgi:hypothetical protein